MHPERITMQKRCIDSVRAQTLRDYQHIKIPGLPYEGGSMEKCEAMLADPALHDRIEGLYVYILDDDDELASAEVLERWDRAAHSEWLHNEPVYHTWYMVKAYLGSEGELLNGEWPKDWTKNHSGRPQMGDVSALNNIVRRDVFVEHAPAFAEGRPGDWKFTNSMWEAGLRPKQVDVLFARTQRVSGGVAEDEPSPKRMR